MASDLPANPARRFSRFLPTFVCTTALACVCVLPLHASNERAIKQRVAPVYPELAKRMKVSGMVKVSATIAPDGSVSATKVVSGNHMLSGAAEDAVHKWRFVPADSESIVEVDVNFALAQ
jgi:TonB family protein